MGHKGYLFSVMAMLALLAGGAAAPAWAQEATPSPTAALTLRYDAGEDLYLIDLIFSDPAQIGSAELNVIDENGVEIQRLAVLPGHRNQSVELSGWQLTPGQPYTLRLRAFSPGGLLLGDEQSGALAAAEFVYDPVTLSHLLLKTEAESLFITVEVTGSANIADYRLLLTDANGIAQHDQPFDPASPSLSMKGLAAGEYNVELRALDDSDRVLATISGAWQHVVPPHLAGTPLFSSRAEPPELVIWLPETGAGVTEYRVILVNQLNQIAHQAQVSPHTDGTVTIPMASVATGEYTVIIRALDEAGATLGESSAAIVYLEPPRPGIIGRIENGLRAQPVLGLFIVLLLFALALFLMVWTLLNRRRTATPLLAGWRLSAGSPNPPPAPEAGTGTPAQPSLLELTVRQSPDRRRAGKTVVVKRYPFLIGREGSDLDLSGDMHISRRHAELRQTAEGLVIIDLLTPNGTYVNGERIPANTPVPLRTTPPARISVGRASHLLLAPARRQ